MRQWFEVPDSAITPTVIFHKPYGSGLKEMCLAPPTFLLSSLLFLFHEGVSFFFFRAGKSAWDLLPIPFLPVFHPAAFQGWESSVKDKPLAIERPKNGPRPFPEGT